jgi:hypothetical protein
MKPLFTFLLLLCIKPAFSQVRNIYIQPLDKIKLKQSAAEKQWRGYKGDEQKGIITNVNDTITQKPQDNMPVVKFTDKQIFLFNNGKGNDVYVSSADNMRILKPDSTFSANLPVKK